jgi:hypothetical protein
MADHNAEQWYPTAAYLYVLHLDDLALAWEYLRRNPEYRRDWRDRQRRPERRNAGGCASWKTHAWTRAMRIRPGFLSTQS